MQVFRCWSHISASARITIREAKKKEKNKYIARHEKNNHAELVSIEWKEEEKKVTIKWKNNETRK